MNGVSNKGWVWNMRWNTESKYHSRKIEIDGMTFHSVKEGSRYQELKMLERAGKIKGLTTQFRIEVIPKTKLHRARFYIADFVYYDNEKQKTIYEDVKGYKKGLAYQLFTLKRDMLYWRHGIEIMET